MSWSAVVIDQLSNDIWVRLRCENCGLVIAKELGYNDRNWWENVLPDRKCQRCTGELKMPRRLSLASLSEHVAARAGQENWTASKEVGKHGLCWRLYIAGVGFAVGDTPKKALEELDERLWKDTKGSK